MSAKNQLIRQIIYGAGGSLDMDSSPRSINKNRAGESTGEENYTNALNVSKISLTDKGDGPLYSVNGNTLAITPPTISAQDKQYLITFPNTTSKTLSVDFINLNGSPFLTPCTPSFSPTTGNLVNDTISFGNAIGAALTASGFTSIINTSVPGNIIVQMTNNINSLGFDYQIVPDSSDNVPLVITTIQEAWDQSLAGLCFPTGNKDWLNDLFIMSSSVGKDPVSFSIVGTQPSLGGDVQINVPGNVLSQIGGASGSYLNVTGVEGTIEANGAWINSAASYNIISAGNTTITLFNCKYVNAYTGGGTVTANINGFFNMSVSQYDVDTDIWTTYNLLQTKQIDSRWNHPYRDVDADSANQITNLYFTDNNDYPRTFSYTGHYLNNGAIQYYNSLGQYTYEDVSNNTRNIIGNIMPIVKVVSVSDVGGAVPSGNWRYTVSLEDANLNTTGTGIFSNPVNIYNGNFGTPADILGTPGSVTSMTVTINISEIPPGFSYINLIGINYVGTAEVAYLIKTVPIPAGATSMDVTHTGLEQDIQNYTTSFVLPSLAYIKAGTQVISNSTLVYGNLTAAEINDFTLASQTLNHILKVNKGNTNSSQPYNGLTPTGDDRTGYTLGEYQLPIQTHNFTGYMLNETYRFWACYELKTGVFTPLFWIDDIRFDVLSTNEANPFNQTGRRVGNNITSYDLSQSPSSTLTQDITSYVFYVTFQSPDIGNYLINGVPLSSLVERIHIFRTDNTAADTDEVLSCGLVVRHVAGTITDSFGDTIFGTSGGGASNCLFESPFLLANGYSGFSLPINDAYLGNYFSPWSLLFGSEPNGWQYGIWNSWGGITANTPYSSSFYSPDWIYGQINISHQSIDTLLCYGQPDWNAAFSFGNMDATCQATIPPGTTTEIVGAEIRLSGSTHVTTEAYAATGSVNLGLQQAITMGQFAGAVPGIAGLVYSSGTQNTVNRGPIFNWDTPQKIWLYNVSPFPTLALTTNAPDIGLYYAQYYRNLGSVTAASSASNYPNNTKFGAITTGEGIPCGAHIDITSNETSASVDVYGGDTFTQKSFLKIRYPTNDNASFVYNVGGGNTVVFFCQNRMNFNMRNPANLAYPQTPAINGWINYPISLPGGSAVEINNYDAGYTPRNPDNVLSAFNPSLPEELYYPDRKIFSQTKPQGSTINNFKIFPPLNFNDDQTNSGPITALLVIDEELYGLHPRAVWRYFYNDLGTFQGQGTGDITLGSSLPFSKPPILLSNNGCSNIFSVIQGKGLDGEDVVCWIDIVNRKVMMLSKAGLKDLTIEKNMRSWFFDNLSFIQPDTTNDNSAGGVPILQNCISGVFDDKRKEFIWSVFNAIGGLEQWSIAGHYTNGDRVYFGVGFEGIKQAWQAIGSPEVGSPPTLGSSSWQLLPQTYTIAYSLLSNQRRGGFSTFYTPLPYFYAEWKETYLTAYPNVTNNPYNGIYIADIGAILTWFEYNSASQQVNGYFEWVTNDLTAFMKQYSAIQISSVLAPYQINFITENQASFLQRSDFRQVFDVWQSFVKNDTLSSVPPGLNNTWTKQLISEYMISGLTFLVGEAQKVSNFVTKFIIKNRNPLS